MEEFSNQNVPVEIQQFINDATESVDVSHIEWEDEHLQDISTTSVI